MLNFFWRTKLSNNFFLLFSNTFFPDNVKIVVIFFFFSKITLSYFYPETNLTREIVLNISGMFNFKITDQNPNEYLLYFGFSIM